MSCAAIGSLYLLGVHLQPETLVNLQHGVLLLDCGIHWLAIRAPCSRMFVVGRDVTH